MIRPELITLTFVLVFLTVQALGMYVGYMYHQAIQSGVLQPALGNPENVANSFYLFGYILIMTLVVIVILKFRSSWLRILEIFVLLMSSWVTFEFLMPVSVGYIDLGLVLAIALTALETFRSGTIIHISAIVFSLSGVGALMGVSLGVLPALVFILIVSIYDFISVFLTKHMVFMAKSMVGRPTIFSLSVPSNLSLKGTRTKRQPPSLRKVRVFGLGSGDIALPLVFTVSLLTNYGLKSALFSLVGVTSVLFLLLNWRIKATSNAPRALPAMPFLSMGLFAGLLLSFLF